MKRKIDPRASVKRPYRAPALKVHGDFRKLTTAKGGGANDGSGKPKTKSSGREYVSAAATRYRVYGLVSEAAIPLSCPTASSARADRTSGCDRASRASVRERAPRASSLPRSRKWFECRRLPDGATYLRWYDLFEFLISSDGTHDRLSSPCEGDADESLTTYLLGQVLSFSLLSRGNEPLHATAVVIDGEAVAFLGDCGYGKSTLGAAFLARGFPILTDDILALEVRDGRWFAHAGPRRLKLFPSVARKILARADGMHLNAGTSKLLLPLSGTEASSPSDSPQGPVRSAQTRTARRADRHHGARRREGLS